MTRYNAIACQVRSPTSLTSQGYLRLGDIFNLDFAADLIVLSACDTGLGKDVNGEGLVGLTRGLMYARAEPVAVSLWNVDDKGTAELMQEFDTQMLKQGKSPTVALRAAQLKLWQDSDWKNPYYWSAFTRHLQKLIMRCPKPL